MELNCKVKREYYSYEYFVDLAKKLGYDSKLNLKTCYCLRTNIGFIHNIFNPIVIFDIQKHEWNKDLLIDNTK